MRHSAPSWASQRFRSAVSWSQDRKGFSQSASQQMRYMAAPAPCAVVGPTDPASAASRNTAATPALRGGP
eukprot:1036975-Lingulodinium_polyedra.AAC.1